MTSEETTAGMFSNIRLIFIIAVVVVLAASLGVAWMNGDTPERQESADRTSPIDETTTDADRDGADREASESAAESSENPASSPEKAAPVTPSFDVVRVSRGGTGVIAGRAEPGARVTVLESGTPVGSVRADARGEWVMILEQPLSPGTAKFSLVAQGDGGGEVPSDDVVVLSVPEATDDPQKFVPSEQDGVVAVLTPKSGEGPSRVLQKPGGAGAADLADQLTVETVDYGQGEAPMITGRAPVGASVAVYMDNDFVAATKADKDGVWKVAANERLSTGKHTIRVDQIIGDGGVQIRIEQPFVVGDALDPGQARAGVVVQEGNTLWQIARQLYGKGVRYTLIFRANSDQITDPDLIYPGQLFQLPSESGREKEGEGGSQSG